jgi:hypothetical protein
MTEHNQFTLTLKEQDMTNEQRLINDITEERLRDWGFTYMGTLTFAGKHIRYEPSPEELGHCGYKFINILSEMQGSQVDYWNAICLNHPITLKSRYHIHCFLGGVDGLSQFDIEAAWRKAQGDRRYPGSGLFKRLDGNPRAFNYPMGQALWTHTNIPELKTANIRREIREGVLIHA